MLYQNVKTSSIDDARWSSCLFKRVEAKVTIVDRVLSYITDDQTFLTLSQIFLENVL